MIDRISLTLNIKHLTLTSAQIVPSTQFVNAQNILNIVQIIQLYSVE